MKSCLRDDPAAQRREYLQSLRAAKLLAPDEHVLPEPIAALWLHMSAAGLLQHCSSAKAGRGRPIAGSGGGSATAGVILTKWIDGRVKAA